MVCPRIRSGRDTTYTDAAPPHPVARIRDRRAATAARTAPRRPPRTPRPTRTRPVPSSLRAIVRWRRHRRTVEPVATFSQWP